VAVADAEKVATFMHAGYSNILRRSEDGRKKRPLKINDFQWSSMG
jgi:hypothetical protein